MENTLWPIEIPENYCIACRRPETKIVRLTEKKHLTQNETLICQNEKCRLFINFEKVRGWKIKDLRHYNRDFWRHNIRDYEKKIEF